MRLFKRNNGIFYLEVERNVWKSLKTRDEKKAQVLKKKLEQKQLQGRLVILEEAEKKSLGDFKKEYLAEQEKTKAADSQRADELALRLLIDVLGEKTILRTITTAQIEKFKSVCLARGVQPVSVNTYLRHIKAALRKAAKLGYIKTPPDIHFIPIRKKPLPRYLRKEEIDAILKRAAEDNPQFHRMLVFYLWTGARRAEALRLEWKHCFLDEDPPYVKLIGKGGKERTVPLLPPVLEIILPHRQSVGRVFPLVHKDTVSDWFHEVAKACGIKARLHDTRHTAATYMLACGIPVPTVQAILGHGSMQTTQIYTHVLTEHKFQQMKKLKFD